MPCRDCLQLHFKNYKKKHSKFFVGVRQKGLMMGLELKDQWAGPVLTKTAYDNDILLIYANNDTSVVQFLPPLIMDEKDVVFVINQLDKALKAAKILHPILKLKKSATAFFKP